MNKSIYNKVAKQINATLHEAYDDTFSVEVVETKNVSNYCDQYSLRPNDMLWDLIQMPGIAQDLFYADELYTITERNGTDYEVYIEPYNRVLFNLARY